MDGMAALALVLQHVGKMSGTAHASVALIPELFSRESNGQLKQPLAGHALRWPGTNDSDCYGQHGPRICQDPLGPYPLDQWLVQHCQPLPDRLTKGHRGVS